MKLKKLEVSGFRSLVDFAISFDDRLTVVVGENDAGKSSLIECLRVVTQARDVLADDFTRGMDDMVLTVEIEDFAYTKRYQLQQGRPQEVSFIARGTPEYVAQTLAYVDTEAFDETTEDGRGEVERLGKLLGVTMNARTNPTTLKHRIVERLRAGGDLTIENAKFPKFNNILLDGRHFENVPSFFKEVFLKEKQASLWNIPVEGQTLNSYVSQHLADYSQEISNQIRQRGIIDKLRLFLSDLTEIRVEPVVSARDFNIDAKVKFLENGQEIPLENRGDGTKRRITMALLEFKKDQTRIQDEGTVYLLDEPDTHLHVRAQRDLIQTVEGFADGGDQVIVTTHSPFILNSVKPEQVRWLSRFNGRTGIRALGADARAAGFMLRSLGIENSHLFFCRKILLVEGETEENFVPAHYLQSTGRMLSSGFIKVLNVRGLHNIPGFARAILELHDRAQVFLLHDNDASPELQQLIDELGLPREQRYPVGTREFEDAFDARDLFHCWSEYHALSERRCPVGWTVEAIQGAMARCAADGTKFSAALPALGAGGKAMSKPVFGTALGNHTGRAQLPEVLRALFDILEAR